MPEDKTSGRTTVKGSIEFHIVTEAVRTIRESAGLSQGELSRLIGKERTYVHKVESGKRVPDIVTFIKILKVCGADVGEAAKELAAEFDKRGS